MTPFRLFENLENVDESMIDYVTERELGEAHYQNNRNYTHRGLDALTYWATHVFINNYYEQVK